MIKKIRQRRCKNCDDLFKLYPRNLKRQKFHRKQVHPKLGPHLDFLEKYLEKDWAIPKKRRITSRRLAPGTASSGRTADFKNALALGLPNW